MVCFIVFIILLGNQFILYMSAICLYVGIVYNYCMFSCSWDYVYYVIVCATMNDSIISMFPNENVLFL